LKDAEARPSLYNEPMSDALRPAIQAALDDATPTGARQDARAQDRSRAQDPSREQDDSRARLATRATAFGFALMFAAAALMWAHAGPAMFVDLATAVLNCF